MSKQGIITFRNSFLTPTTIDRSAKTFTGCAYDSSGRLIKAAQRTSANVIWVPTDPEQLTIPDAELLRGRYIYLGHFTGHYGHFILESISRLWAVLQGERFDGLIYHPFVHAAPPIHTFDPAVHIFQALGVPLDKIIVLKKKCKVEELVVPDSKFVINNSYSPDMAILYEFLSKSAISSTLPPNGARIDKLYLSRRRFGKTRKIVNENELEAALWDLGFRVIYPEELTFRDQLGLYRNAAVLIGLSGSALHNSVFMSAGSWCITLGDLRNPLKPIRNQVMCDEIGRVRSAFIPFAGDILDKSKNIGAIDVTKVLNKLKKLGIA